MTILKKTYAAGALLIGILWALVVCAQPAYAAPTNLESDVTSATLDYGAFSQWVSQPVTVTLKVPAWASKTMYHFGTGEERTYTEPIGISREGKTVLYFQSSSSSSVEPLQTQQVWLDFTPPTMPGEALFSEPKSNGFTFGFKEAHDALSGVASYEVTVTSVDRPSAVTTQTLMSTSGTVSKLTPGSYTLTYAAKDLAGNISSERSALAMVGIAAPRLTYTFDEPDVAAKVKAGSWITTGVDVRLTARIESQAPTTTVSMQTISGSVETTDVAQRNYAAIPLIINQQGQGNVTLSASDMYGNNSSESSFPIKIDRIAPTPVSLLMARVENAVSDGSKKNLVVDWNPSTDAASGVDYYKVTVQRLDAGFAGVTEKLVDDTSLVMTDIPAGSYRVSVQAFDKAGLSSALTEVSRSVSTSSSQASGAVTAAKTPASTTNTTNTTTNNTTTANTTNNAAPSAPQTAAQGKISGVESTASAASAGAGGATGKPADETSILAERKSLGANDSAKTLPLGKRLRNFLKNEWQIWVPALLALIALIALIVHLIRARRREAQINNPEGFSDEFLEQTPGINEPAPPVSTRLTAKQTTRLGEAQPTPLAAEKEAAQPQTDQAATYYHINND